MPWIEPVTLENPHVCLLPLAAAHASALADAAADGALWQLWYTSVPAPAAMADAVAAALAEQAAGRSVVFVVVDRARDEIVGSTRYLNIDAANRRLEIGHTWYAERAQRSVINGAAKRLLLGHAFDERGAIAVELRTHWHNRRSRAAIERLGARQDGVLRQHRVMADGSYRDTVVYSILDREWPGVRRNLDFRLEQMPSPGQDREADRPDRP